MILDRARVALNAGHCYGSGGAGHARLNLACDPDVLREAVRRIAALAGSAPASTAPPPPAAAPTGAAPRAASPAAPALRARPAIHRGVPA
ncbi:hypothetical protein QFZ62_001990 [Clavibacter sp. B3I6]|uniref:hypothetical protein n=1 Tax=Clavibacter sp. B3I6 TaxID=3042268 RepID=UPI002784249A|nr:hypothetical protein [Clavibacter sp. B3I6]